MANTLLIQHTFLTLSFSDSSSPARSDLSKSISPISSFSVDSSWLSLCFKPVKRSSCSLRSTYEGIHDMCAIRVVINNQALHVTLLMASKKQQCSTGNKVHLFFCSFPVISKIWLGSCNTQFLFHGENSDFVGFWPKKTSYKMFIQQTTAIAEKTVRLFLSSKAVVSSKPMLLDFL